MNRIHFHFLSIVDNVWIGICELWVTRPSHYGCQMCSDENCISYGLYIVKQIGNRNVLMLIPQHYCACAGDARKIRTETPPRMVERW